jgi:hypothetical protein
MELLMVLQMDSQMEQPTDLQMVRQKATQKDFQSAPLRAIL